MIPFVASLLSSVGNIGSSIGANFINEYFYRLRNAHLTGKEREQNEFNAQQAQLNRDFEQEMSNTANQRAVADMQNAGLNPALMYGNGSAASTPTGSNAQGSASVSNGPDMASMIAAMTNMKLAEAEIKEKESNAKLMDKSAEKLGVDMEQVRVGIEGSKLDNKQKEIVYKYLDHQEELKTRSMEMDNEQKDLQNKQLSLLINRMPLENLKLFGEYLKDIETVNELKHREKVDDATAYNLYKSAANMDKVTEKLGLDIENYDLTNGVKIKLDVGFGPFKAGSEQYLTLSQLREYLKVKQSAEENKGKGKENNAGLDYHDYRVD